MKKLISLLLAFVLCAGIYTVSFSADIDLLNTLGIKFDLTDDARNMTRGKFAKIVATLMGSEELSPCDTRFPDVDNTNFYSGYIEFLAAFCVISSGEGIEYHPDRDIQIAEAAKMLIAAVGLTELAEKKGGYPQGYMTVANDFDFLKKVNFTPYVTEFEMGKLVLNAITSKLPSAGYSHKGMFYTNGNHTVITDRMKVSGYRGTIEGVDTETYTVRFKARENLYENNPVVLQSREIKSYLVSKNINITEFYKAPVNIWVHESGEIIYISLEKNVKNVYGYVSSVNGNSEGLRPVGVSFIESIELYNDETKYRVGAAAEVNLNHAAAPGEVNLINTFVRMVSKNDEIICIEAYNMTEGGIVTSVIRDKMEYVSGESINKVLKDFAKNARVFINGQPADWREIREASVMDFFQTQELTIITVAEKVITDILYSVSNHSVEVGATEYLADDVYFKTSGGYVKNSGYSGLLSKEVTAFFAPNGKVKYICQANESTERGSEFLGIVSGVSYNDFAEQGKIELWVTQPETEKIVLHFDKLKFSDGITLEELKANAKNTDGDGVYKFRTNGKDKLLEVLKAPAYYGLGLDPARFEVGSFISDTYAVVYTGNKRLLFGNDTPVYAIYDFEGDFRIKKLTWADINGRYTGPNKGKITFFGEKLQSTPSLVVLGGDLSSLGSEGRGILVDKSQTLDKAGNSAVCLKIIEASGEKRYVISEYEASFLPQFALLEYYKNLLFSVDDIKITSVSDMSGDVSTWDVQETEDANGYRFGRVDKVDSNRLFVDESRAYCFPDIRKPCLFIKADLDKADSRRFTKIDKSEIMHGDTVYYNLNGGLANVVFVIQ